MRHSVCLDQLSRLHMILKPFMLRRIKKDVENELSDKVSRNSVYIDLLSNLGLNFCNFPQFHYFLLNIFP